MSREYSQLEPVVKLLTSYEQAEADLGAAQEMANDNDAEIRKLGEEESATIGAHLAELELELKKQLIPKDPRDDSNIFLEIRNRQF